MVIDRPKWKWRWAALGCFTLLATGCAPWPKPALLTPLVAASAASIRVDHYLGTPLSGTLLQVPDRVEWDDALTLEATFVALDRLPQDVMDSLGSHARMIIANHRAAPVRATPMLTRSAEFAQGAAAEKFSADLLAGKFGRSLIIAHRVGVLAPGITARFDATDSPNGQPVPIAGVIRRRFQVDLSMPIVPQSAPATAPAGVTVELAVVLDDLALPRGSINADTDDAVLSAAAARVPMLQQEMVLLDPASVADHQTVAVLVPFRFRDGKNQAVAAIVRLRKGIAGDPLFQADCDLAADDLDNAYAAALSASKALPAATSDSATIFNALAGMVKPQTRRSSSAFLADWSGARVCEDMLLSADDQVLLDLVDELADHVGRVAPEKPAVGWEMDRIALHMLARLQADGKLPPELEAILADRTGEAGRHESALEELLREPVGAAEFSQRLIATNLLYLEDSSPASRARAYEWLKTRGLAPAGYQPLAPSRERRSALEKFAADRAAAPAATQPGVVQ